MNSKEFAKLIGVSQATVSRALNDSELVPEAKRKYIQQQAREYGFILNSYAKSLRTQRASTIGILFPKHFVSMGTNMMLACLYDCIQQELHKYDYDIMVIHNALEAHGISSFERILRARKVDGFLILSMELTVAETRLIEEYQVPCIFLLNASAKLPSKLNYLFSDSKYGGIIAGEYLGKYSEYQKFFLSPKGGRDDAKRRLQGFRNGLENMGYHLPEENILYCDMSIESAYDCILKNRHRLDDRKSAFFTHNDILGLGVVSACQKLGYQIPDQVQLISMDDIPLASALHPQLSTLHVAVEEMVPRGCKLLIDMINGEACPTVREWIKPTLYLRETTL